MALHDLAAMEIPPPPFTSSSSSSSSPSSSPSENGRYFECIPTPSIVKYTKLFIDGSFVDSISGRTFATIDPRNGEVIARVAEADSDDVDVAVRASRKAFQEGPWPRMTGYERGRVLFKFADLVERSIEELSMLETLDNGKPLLMSRNVDFSISIKLLRHCAGWADKISGSTLKVDGPFHAYTLYEPMGVVGAIIPWNFPALMFIMKLAPALAAGNCLVIKSAEQTPLSALHLASIAKEAGVPNGVINVLSGFGASVGAAIASHMDIDKISFTGSTEVGRLIMKASAESNMKNVTLELGGKSPLIICQDADIDIALEISHEAVFFNQGQCCFAATRTFVHEDIYDEFVEKSIKKAKAKIVGDPFQKEVEQGPQIDETQLHQILSYIELGKKEGARLVAGGSRLGSQGYFIEPTVFADVQDDMKIAQDEIFGPVMQILKFKTMEEVITRANNTRYGLAVGIITKDMDVANTLSRSIKAGVVWLNCYSMLDPSIPFGGYKMSGIGREQGGVMGILNYMQVKSVISPLTKGSPWL